MDQATITLVVSLVTGAGAALWKMISWLGGRIDRVVDRHEKFIDKLDQEIDWKRSKLSDIQISVNEIHEAVGDIHGAVVQPEPKKPSKIIIKTTEDNEK